jgi:hypothetical protein
MPTTADFCGSTGGMTHAGDVNSNSGKDTDMINTLKHDFRFGWPERSPGGKTMKTIFLAAAAALTLGADSAFAQGGSSASGYVYPDFWGPQAAQAAPKGHSVTQSNGDAIGTYMTHTDHSNGTWLFPADPWGGG